MAPITNYTKRLFYGQKRTFAKSSRRLLICRIYTTRFGQYFALLCKLIHLAYALYAVSVRQTWILLLLSFRFHLTMDTLVANSSY